MNVTRMPCDPGVTGWNAILPAPGDPDILQGDATADWLVIGGGFAGLAAARRLAQLQPGDSVALLEAGRIAEGPAGRNSGFMIDLPHDLSSGAYAGAVEADLAQTRANRAAIEFASSMAQEFGLPEEAFRRSGKTNGAAGERGMRHNLAYAEHLARMGEAHELLDAAQMRDLTGSGHYLGGLRTPGTALIQPAMFVRGIAAGLRSAGVRVHERSPVVALVRRGGGWCARTPDGSVSAPRVILAVNGHAESFGRFRGRLLHVFIYASMTRALDAGEIDRLGGAPQWGVTPSDPVGTTVRRISGAGGDRLVVRNRAVHAPFLKVSPGSPARMGRSHDQALAARFPALGGVEMAFRWGGRLCLSRNGAPALGEVEEGLFSACCQNGLGAARGTLHGMLMAELAAGRRSELLDQVMAQGGPSRLPPLPLTALGAAARIMWEEWRAGREL